MPAKRFSLLLIAVLLAVYLIWGSTYLAIRIGVESWPPLLMAGIRFPLAGALMYGWLRWRGVAAPTLAQWNWPGCLACFCLRVAMAR